MTDQTFVKSEMKRRPSVRPGRARLRRLRTERPIRARTGVRYGLFIWLARVLIFAVVFGAWQKLATSRVLNPTFTGTPSKILHIFWQNLTDKALISQLGETLEATLIAFVIGSIAAILFGAFLNSSNFASAIFKPYLTAANSVPRIALIPIFLIWFGFGLMAAIAVAITLNFFIVLENTVAGLQSVESDHLTMARLFLCGRWRTFVTFTWPTAVPAIAAGLQLGLVYSFLGVVGQEMLAGSSGIGAALEQDASTFHMDAFFAGLLALVIVTVVIAQIMKAGETYLTRWKRAGA